MNQPFDISTIIFAALAIFVLWKLRSVLGTRTGEERPPYNPFARRNRVDANTPPGEMGRVIPLPGAAPAEPRQAGPNPDRWKGVVASDAPGAVAGLDQIAAADPSFSGKGFMDGARAAYEMIVSAFAKGDRETLKPLLAPDVFEGFASAITERESRGETVEHTFVALDGALVEHAQVRAQAAQIAVRFESQQINAVRSREGTLVEAGTDAVGHVTDHWTFARDVGARDPNWRLVATNAE